MEALIYKKEFTVQHIHLDGLGRIKPSVMLHFIMRTISAQCTQLGVSWDDIRPLGLIWVVGRSRLQVIRAPRLDEKVIIETWPMPATRSAFPRAAVAKNDKGEVLYRCTTLWALVNMTTRKLVLPEGSGVNVPGYVSGDELPVPNSFAAAPLGQIDQRRVCFSELDLNGHMNNTKYLDWVNDLLPSSYHKDHIFRDVTICYLSEALEGQTLTLSLNHLEDGSLQVDGLRSETNDLDKKNRVFSVKVTF